MYLAREKTGKRTRYLIRESHLENGVYIKRDLMDLGENPRRYVLYPGGRSFYIDPEVEDALLDVGAPCDQELLEELFEPFIDPGVLRRYARSRSRGRDGRTEPVPSSNFHLFDRRRLYYLKFGQMDLRGLFKTSPSLFRVLHEKSRDEIEQNFMAMEMKLAPRELKSYLFASFDLQRHFYKSFAREMPHALDQSEVDRFFLSDLCKLNGDEGFWAGMAEEATLRDYLRRYAIMFFDTEYAESRYYDEILQNFINSRRDVPFPRRQREEAAREGAGVFGLSERELLKMSADELSRLYRKKAREYHPDHGGREEDFVTLTKIYEELKSGKK